MQSLNPDHGELLFALGKGTWKLGCKSTNWFETTCQMRFASIVPLAGQSHMEIFRSMQLGGSHGLLIHSFLTWHLWRGTALGFMFQVGPKIATSMLLVISEDVLSISLFVLVFFLLGALFKKTCIYCPTWCTDAGLAAHASSGSGMLRNCWGGYCPYFAYRPWLHSGWLGSPLATGVHALQSVVPFPWAFRQLREVQQDPVQQGKMEHVSRAVHAIQSKHCQIHAVLGACVPDEPPHWQRWGLDLHDLFPGDVSVHAGHTRPLDVRRKTIGDQRIRLQLLTFLPAPCWITSWAQAKLQNSAKVPFFLPHDGLHWPNRPQPEATSFDRRFCFSSRPKF